MSSGIFIASAITMAAPFVKKRFPRTGKLMTRAANAYLKTISCPKAGVSYNELLEGQKIAYEYIRFLFNGFLLKFKLKK